MRLNLSSSREDIEKFHAFIIPRFDKVSANLSQKQKFLIPNILYLEKKKSGLSFRENPTLHKRLLSVVLQIIRQELFVLLLGTQRGKERLLKQVLS